MAIETPRELQAHLQSAIEVEASTIPPYLYAMYSIEDPTSESYKLIRSVVVEEMLHMSLAANVLTAVGGTPRFYDEDVLPSYPRPLPHRQPELELTLEACSPEVVGRVFTTVERPRTVEGIPDDADYETVGQFYRAIERAVERLEERYPLFQTCRTGSQMTESRYYRPVEYDVDESGGIHAVDDVASAMRAIETVIHQGEGLTDERYADLDHREMTHYYKFKRIADGDVPVGETRPVVENPTIENFPRSIRPAAELFNACYCYAFYRLEDVYSPIDGATRDRIVGGLYAIMQHVLQLIARFLTSRPASEDPPRRAGPTFEFYRFDTVGDPTEELLELCGGVVEVHPELEGIGRVLERACRLG